MKLKDFTDLLSDILKKPRDPKPTIRQVHPALTYRRGFTKREFMTAFGSLAVGIFGGVILPDCPSKEPQVALKDPVCPEIPPPLKCPDTPKPPECETIVDKTLNKLLNELLECLQKQFNFTPESFAQKKIEAQQYCNDLNEAFSNLNSQHLTHYEDEKGKDIIHDAYFAARINEGPFKGKVIIIRKYKYKLKEKDSQEIEEIFISKPVEVKDEYRVEIVETGIGKGINRDYAISLIPRDNGKYPASKAALLAVMNSLKLPNKVEKQIIYAPPHGSDLKNPYLIAKGFHYFQKVIREAWSNVRYEGKNMPYKQDFGNVTEEDFIADIMTTENVDADLLIRGGDGTDICAELNKVFLTLALNGENAFKARKSSADARGILQIIPETYKDLHDRYGTAILSGDFQKDTMEHKFATILAILHLYDQYVQILNRKTIAIDPLNKTVTPTHIQEEKKCYFLEEVYAAGYNSSMPGVLDIIMTNKQYPEDLKKETRPYLEKLRLAELYLKFLREFFKGIIEKEEVIEGMPLDIPQLVDVKGKTDKGSSNPKKPQSKHKKTKPKPKPKKG